MPGGGLKLVRIDVVRLCACRGYLIISDGEPVPLATLGLGRDGRCQVPQLTYLSKKKKKQKTNSQGKVQKLALGQARIC